MKCGNVKTLKLMDEDVKFSLVPASNMTTSDEAEAGGGT